MQEEKEVNIILKKDKEDSLIFLDNNSDNVYPCVPKHTP